MNDIITAISTVGYPIVMSLLTFWYIKYSQDAHKEEIAHLTESLNNNTIAITKLTESLRE